jgi:hypothetical protein
VLGREAMVLEERRELRMGWVRCGTYGVKESSGVFEEVRIFVRVWRSWSWRAVEIGLIMASPNVI